MKISILGCGWYGSELALHLEGHELLGTTRTPEKVEMIRALGVKPFLITQTPPDEVLQSECIVLNIPPHENQLKELKSWKWNHDSWIIFISSTSAYNQTDGILNQEEEWVQKSFKQWTILRFGGLIGKNRHPGKFLSGRTNIKGRLWPVNLIHLEDTVGITKTVIDLKIQNKIIDVVSDEHETKEDFYSEFAIRKNLPLPVFDQNDLSTGKLIQNDELKKFYQLKWPRMIGKET
jgi:nucleoside-diphosphate-sugar epimerase